MEHHHAVADFETRNILAKSSNHTGGLMAKDPRGRMRARCNFL